MAHCGEAGTWDTKTVSWGVDRALRPLARTIHALVAARPRSRRKKGGSKKAAVLVMAVEVATANFVERGEAMGLEHPREVQAVGGAVGAVRSRGAELVTASREFAGCPLCPGRREEVVRAAEALLTAVAGLLVLADRLDCARDVIV